MKARVNTCAVQQSCLQSSALGVLGSIAHPVGRPGEYSDRVMQGKSQVAEFSLHAGPDVDATQVTIDLARIAGSPRPKARTVRGSCSTLPRSGAGSPS